MGDLLTPGAILVATSNLFATAHNTIIATTAKPTPCVQSATAPDMPDSTAHLDMFGRAIRTAVEGFSDIDRRVDVFYDARGRTACESEPYHAGETAKYTRYAHDIRNRLTGAIRPDGGATGVEYAAASNKVTATVTETVTASDGTEAAMRKTKRVHNVLGELVSTTEGAE